MIATIQEVERFLNTFHQKVEVFDIFFMDDREKNLGAIDSLGIIRGMRKEIIKSLTIEDYSEGPIKNILNAWGDLWVFCISFHLAEYPMNYPYKKGGKS